MKKLMMKLTGQDEWTKNDTTQVVLAVVIGSGCLGAIAWMWNQVGV